MHHECAVSQCGRPTQDRICQSHVDELIREITSIYSNPHAAAPATRLVLVKDGTETRELPREQTGLWQELDVNVTKQNTAPRMERTSAREGSPTLFSENASDARGELEWTVNYWTYAFSSVNDHLAFDPFTATVPEKARWLATFPGLLAGLDLAEAMLDDFRRATFTAARVVDCAPTRGFLGICGGVGEAQAVCEAKLWLYADMPEVMCKDCGTRHDVYARQVELLREIQEKRGTATEVSRLVQHYSGLEVKVNSIRTWARLGELKAVDESPSGHPVYRVWDVFLVSEGKKSRNRQRAA
jgi:hypothetical protein